MLFRFLLLLPVLLSPGTTAAGDGAQYLRSFLSGLRTLQADFEQELSGAGGEFIERAGGRVWISRPGRFRWDYRQPWEQVILGDGRRLWSYDADLEQATVQPMEAALAATPAALLSSERDPETLFVIRELETDGEGHDLELEPRAADSGFERMRLRFARDALLEMELLDGLGRTTRIRFSGMRRNADLPEDIFRFEPPPGVDVLGEVP